MILSLKSLTKLLYLFDNFFLNLFRNCLNLAESDVFLVRLAFLQDVILT